MKNPRDGRDENDQDEPDWQISFRGHITFGEIIVIVALVALIVLNWAFA